MVRLSIGVVDYPQVSQVSDLTIALQGHVVGMYLEQARSGVFRPVLSEALLRCKATLPWWQ